VGLRGCFGLVERELAAYLAVTRRLPYMKGAGAVANALKRVYTRRRRPEVEVDVLGMRMRLEPNEVVDRDLLFAPQLYDRPQLDLLRRRLHRGDVFLDVGANVGVYALVASPLVGPSGHVVAVEADPYNHAKLARHVTMNDAKNVSVLHLGVADTEGTLMFAPGIHGNRGGGSFVFSNEQNTPVRTKTLLGILDDEGIVEAPAAMKMDIELFEHRVMKRFFEDAPRARWPCFLLLERHDDPKFLELAGGDIIALCEANGYRVVWNLGGEYALALGLTEENH